MLKQINVEPVILLYCVSLGIYFTVYSAFIYQKECMGIFQSRYSGDQLDTFCTYLAKNVTSASNSSRQTLTADEDEVQRRSSAFSELLQYAYSLPAAVTSIMLGSWSDRHGRKPVLVLALTGYTVCYLPTIACAALPSLSLYVFLAGTFINGLTTGGIVASFMASFAMISDEVVRVNPERLTIRLGIGSGCLAGGILLGHLISAVILSTTHSFTLVFASGQLSMFLATLYAVIFVRETMVDVDSFTQSTKRELMDCCNFRMFKDAFLTILKRRPHRARLHLNVSLITFFVYFACDLGVTTGLVLLYLKAPPLAWSDSKYAYFMAASDFFAVIGMVAFPIVFKFLLPLKDSGIVALTVAFSFAKWLLFAFSNADWMIYLFGALNFFTASIYPAVRSFIAQQVDKDEVGRVFAAVAVAENVAPVLSAAVFNNIYSATLTLYHGLVFLISAVVLALCFASFTWVHFDSSRKSGTGELDSDADEIWNSNDENTEDSARVDTRVPE